jgi:hypothetical protein
MDINVPVQQAQLELIVRLTTETSACTINVVMMANVLIGQVIMPADVKYNTEAKTVKYLMILPWVALILLLTVFYTVAREIITMKRILEDANSLIAPVKQAIRFAMKFAILLPAILMMVTVIWELILGRDVLQPLEAFRVLIFSMIAYAMRSAIMLLVCLTAETVKLAKD